MENFNFIVKDDNKKAFNVFFLFLFFLHFSAAAFLITKGYLKAAVIQNAGYILPYIIFIVLFFLFKRTRYAVLPDNYILLTIYVAFWVAQKAFLPLIVVVAVILIAKFLQKKKNIITVSTEVIMIKGILSTKKYGWPDIDNLILKDNLLSVDLRSNTLFQFDIDPVNLTNTNEILFNQFCRKQLVA